MDTYDQATQQSIQNFNKMQAAIKPSEPSRGFLNTFERNLNTYINRGIELPKVSEEGKLGFLGQGINFLGQIGTDILNIPSNIIGGSQQIARGDTLGGIGRLGQGGLDLATTLLTFGTGKLITKGAQKAVLGGALGGLEGAALSKAGRDILGKEVLKGAGIGAGVGAGYGLFGGLRDLDKVPVNERTDFLMSNILTGGAIGGLTGGIGNALTVRSALKDLNKIETNVLKGIIDKNKSQFVYTNPQEYINKDYDILFHGTRQPIRQGKGLFSLTNNRNIAADYSQGAGGRRDFYTDPITGKLVYTSKIIGAKIDGKEFKINPKSNLFESGDVKYSFEQVQKLGSEGRATEIYEGERVDEFFLPKNAKILDLTTQEGLDEFKTLSSKGNKEAEGILEYVNRQNDFDWGETKEPTTFNKIFLPQLEEKGYVGIRYADNSPSGSFKATAVFDTKTLKTRQELIEEYNKINKASSDAAYANLLTSPINSKGQYVFDIISEDLKKASLEAIANQKTSLLGKIWQPIDSALKPVKGLGQNMQAAFADWVNTRSATGVYGFLKFKEFRELVDKGIQGILDFEKDASKFPTVKKYFDDMYETLVKAGILKQDQYFKEVNYLPLMFDNTAEEVASAFEKKRRLSMKPSFAFERVMESYNEGIALGLKPKFGNIAELAQWYEKSARKAIADRNFFDVLVKNRWVVPSRKAPADWVELGQGFPKYTTKTKDGFLEDRYATPPEFAQVINNYLASRDEGIMAAIGKFYDGVKQRLLTAGIPMTGFNFHGFSTLMRYTFGSGKNPFTSVAQGLYFMIRPKAALKRIEKSLELIPEAVESGLVVSEGSLKKLLYNKEQLKREFESEFKDKGYVTKNFGRLWNWYKEIVEDPLMEQIIPAYKIETWKNTYNTYKAYLPDKEARKRAAEFTNNLLGGLNYDEMGRSQEMRNLMKFVLLAPDWFETNATILKRTGQSLWDTDKNFRAYRSFAVNFLGSYVFFNAVNKAMSGKYMWENEPGQKFSIDTGTYDEQGNKRYIQIYGTGVDFARLPVDTIDGIVNEDYGVVSRLARNRLSPLGSALVSLYSNTDYAGRPLFGTDKYGNPMSFEQNVLGLSSVAGQFFGVPTILGEPIRNIAEQVTTGKGQPLERTLVEAVDLPVRYKAEVSDITRLQKERTTDRRELEQAIINNDVATAQRLSKKFTQREINTIISNISERQVGEGLTTREKLFNRLSEQQKLELARTNPEFNAMYNKINTLKTQKESDPVNRFKDILTGKPAIKAKKPKRPRKIRARKVRATKPKIKKIRAVKVKPLTTIKNPQI